MRSRVLTTLALVAALVGLAASLASLVDYLGTVPTFCAESGCATVRASAWSHPLGIPMPLLGVVYFAVMLVLCAWARPRVRLALALAGGAWALGLIGLQAFEIHAWCKLCMIADPAAILGAVAVAGGAKTLRPTLARGLLAAPAVAGLVLGLGALTRAAAPAIPPGTPACVARVQTPGQVTLVEFVDFECPFCRALQKQLVAALPKVHAPVRVIRKMVPLPIHAHAMNAALAWCCADAQGKGEAMAEALFAADPATLTPAGCEEIAARVGCDLDRYHRDMPFAVGRVASDMLQALGAGVHGLPTLFVNTQRLVGADHSASDLVATIDHAAR